MNLYLDSSEFLHIGLLDDQWNWLEKTSVQDKKNSTQVHQLIFELCKKQNETPQSIRSLFFIAGPGSYTGIRVMEGIGQIFEMNKIPTYSFHHFEIPSFLGSKNYIWISKAFKGEYFVYRKKGDFESKDLISSANFPNLIKEALEAEEEIYTHYIESIDLCDAPIVETSRMIADFSPSIFDYVLVNKIRKGPFYYRSLEDEFRVSLPDY